MNCRKRRIFSFLTSALLCSLPSFGFVNCMEKEEMDIDNNDTQNEHVGGQTQCVGSSQATVLECLGMKKLRSGGSFKTTVLECLGIQGAKGRSWDVRDNAPVANKVACAILMIISRLIYNNNGGQSKLHKRNKFRYRLNNFIEPDNAKKRAEAIISIINDNSFLIEHFAKLGIFVDAVCRNHQANLKDLSLDDKISFYQYQEKINKVIYEILCAIAPTNSTKSTTKLGGDWVDNISNNHEMRLDYFDDVEFLLLK